MAPGDALRGTHSAPNGRFARFFAGRGWAALLMILALLFTGIVALRDGPVSNTHQAVNENPGPGTAADPRPVKEGAIPAPASSDDASRSNSTSESPLSEADLRDPRAPGLDKLAANEAIAVSGPGKASDKAALVEEGGRSEKSAEPGLSISGAVMDDRGHLLPGIPVTARPLAATPADELSAGAVAISRTTDGFGIFTFEGLQQGEYDLTADGGASYQPAHARVRAGVVSAELRLQRLRSVRLHGMVTGTGDVPLGAVRIRVLGDENTVVTDAAGRYEIHVDLVKAGQPPVLEFVRPHYRERVERLEAVLRSDADSVRLDVRMEPSEVDVALSGRVAGRNGVAAAGTEVWLSSPDPRDFQRTITGNQGEYVFARVEVGDAYRIGVENADGYKPFVSDPFAVGPADTFRDIVLEEAGEGWLTGEVVDPEGSPLANFMLWLRTERGGGAPLPVRTDAGGRFQVADVPSGQLKLESRSQPYLHATGISLLANETRHVVVPLDWGPHWLFGQVIDGDGTPVAAARIVLQWNRQYPDVYSVSRREVSSDRLGYFTFANLGAGEHVLTISAPGFERTRLVKDPRQETGEFLVALRSSASSQTGAGQ